MIKVRRDPEIFRQDGDWYSARWHFSFDAYLDLAWMGFGNMRVFNDDRLIPGAVWPMHPHRDVEGLTYVVEGSFRHQDDVGGPPGPLLPGSVQRMTLGSGALHSEQNASETEPMRFIQIWIKPSTPGLEPGVQQRVFEKADHLRPLITPDGRDGSATVHANASLLAGVLPASTTHEWSSIEAGTGLYAYVIDGEVALGDERLGTGDAAVIADEPRLLLKATRQTELLVVEVDLTDPW